MSSKRGQSGLSGILLVDKPAGMTSHDVVAAVRRATGEGRVGHAGTLDPMATGLLVVLVGPATRLAPYLAERDKAYDAIIKFGIATDTDDAEGEIVRTAPVDNAVFDPAAAQSLLDGFLGGSEQTPPAFSAIKVGGRTAHRVARAGEQIELAARPIEVLEARLQATDAEAGTWTVAFRVSKGTYIRALARDIGTAARTAAHLSALRRTRSGGLSVEDAVPLDTLVEAAQLGEVSRLFADPVDALALVVVETGPDTVANGVALPRGTSDAALGELVAVVADGALAAVYRSESDKLVAQTVLAAPISRRP